MKNHFLFTLSILLFIGIKTISAQDLIIKKDNEQIKAKIIEIGETEIKYKLFDAPDGPTIVINKREVKTLKIQGKNDKSTVMDVGKVDPMSVGNNIIADKTSSLKFHFFAPLNSHLAFTYEWMIKPGFNWEAGLGIVGIGTSPLNGIINYHPKGAYIRTGCKFLLGSSSDIEIDGARYAHPLKGRYFKVEGIFYALGTNYTDYDDYGSNPISVHSNFNGMALDLTYGRQFIFGNSITVGWYAGIGYGFESKSVSYLPTGYTDLDDHSRYSHFLGTANFPVAFTYGFNIGYIFKTPTWVSNIGKKSRSSNRPPDRHSMSNE